MDTISRWIRTVMHKAMVSKPHSTQTASTNKAGSCNVSLPAVMKAASWSSDCVFNTFYDKPVQSQAGFSPEFEKWPSKMYYRACSNKQFINIYKIKQFSLGSGRP